MFVAANKKTIKRRYNNKSTQQEWEKNDDGHCDEETETLNFLKLGSRYRQKSSQR